MHTTLHFNLTFSAESTLWDTSYSTTASYAHKKRRKRWCWNRIWTCINTVRKEAVSPSLLSLVTDMFSPPGFSGAAFRCPNSVCDTCQDVNTSVGSCSHLDNSMGFGTVRPTSGIKVHLLLISCGTVNPKNCPGQQKQIRCYIPWHSSGTTFNRKCCAANLFLWVFISR